MMYICNLNFRAKFWISRQLNWFFCLKLVKSFERNATWNHIELCQSSMTRKSRLRCAPTFWRTFVQKISIFHASCSTEKFSANTCHNALTKLLFIKKMLHGAKKYFIYHVGGNPSKNPKIIKKQTIMSMKTRLIFE